MTDLINPDGELARLFPPDYAAAIVAAGRDKDFTRLDRLTDELVRQGYCRPRSELSLRRGDKATVLARFTGAAA